MTLCTEALAAYNGLLPQVVLKGGPTGGFVPATAADVNVPIPNGVTRSVLSRALDLSNIVDYGADVTGTNSSNTALTNATTAATSGAVLVPPGAYSLGSTFTPTNNVPYFVEGASFSSSGSAIVQAGDWSAYLNGRIFSFFKTTTTAGNDYTQHVSLYIAPSNSQTSTEKAASYIFTTNADSSGTNYFHDGVGQIVSSNIAPGNKNGHAIGQHVVATVNANSDGVASGQEIDIQNFFGTDETQGYFAAPQTGYPKAGLGIYAYGNTPVDAGLVMGSSGQSGAIFSDYIRLLQSGVRDYAFRLICDQTGGNLTTICADVDKNGNVAGQNVSGQSIIALGASVKSVAPSASSGGSQSCTGTGSAAPTSLTKDVTNITYAGASAYFILSGVVGQIQDVVNRSTTSYICPPAGGTIDLNGTVGAANAAFAVPYQTSARFVCTTSGSAPTCYVLTKTPIVLINDYTGNGSTTAFPLSSTPTAVTPVAAWVGGIYQNSSSFSVSGATLTFASAPPSNASIEVRVGP